MEKLKSTFRGFGNGFSIGFEEGVQSRDCKREVDLCTDIIYYVIFNLIPMIFSPNFRSLDKPRSK